MKDRTLKIDTGNTQEIINQWALSVFQRLEREHPEVLRVLLSKEVQLDQRRKNKTSKRTSGEI
jgi:hypothetical protein